MRLFIAVPFDDAMRAGVRRAQDEFRRLGFEGRYTKPENLHLTLAFIGEYSNPEDVLDAMANVPFEPFELALSGVGAFGDLWWVGVEANPALEAYARRLRRALAQAGIPFDGKPFSPHITVLRRATGGRRGAPIPPPSGRMRVDHIALMRSTRGRDGQIYTEIR